MWDLAVVVFRSSRSVESCTDRYSYQLKNNNFAEMSSGSEKGSCLRRIDFVYHSTLGSRVRTKKQKKFDLAVVVAWLLGRYLLHGLVALV